VVRDKPTRAARSATPLPGGTGIPGGTGPSSGRRGNCCCRGWHVRGVRAGWDRLQDRVPVARRERRPAARHPRPARSL